MEHEPPREAARSEDLGEITKEGATFGKLCEKKSTTDIACMLVESGSIDPNSTYTDAKGNEVPVLVAAVATGTFELEDTQASGSTSMCLAQCLLQEVGSLCPLQSQIFPCSTRPLACALHETACSAPFPCTTLLCTKAHHTPASPVSGRQPGLHLSHRRTPRCHHS